MVLINQSILILQALRDPTRNDHTSALQTLDKEVSNPSFVLHVLYLFSRGYSHGDIIVAADLRQLGGLIIKNYSIGHFMELSTDARSVMMSEILHALSDNITEIRNTASILIGRIAESLPISMWGAMLEHLMLNLDSQETLRIDGALSAIVQVCEDSSEKLVGDSQSRPLDVIVPRLLALMQHFETSFRLRSVTALNSLLFTVPTMDSPPLTFGNETAPPPNALQLHMNTFLQGLSSLSADPVPAIRRAVCQALVLLAGLQLPRLQPAIDSICQFMLRAVDDPDSDVALEACEFWATLAGCEEGRDVTRQYLMELIPKLQARMVYTEEQVMQERADEEAQASGEKKVNLKPLHHKSSGRSTGDDGTEEGEDSFQWTLRKQAALVLDKVAVDFAPDEVLAAALPTIQSRLQSPDVWIRESALLALGAMANGCQYEMHAHLSGLVPFLLALVADAVPEVRSIACWVLSRYCVWIFQDGDERGDSEIGGGFRFLPHLIACLAKSMLDPLPKVQSAASSALCVVMDEGRDAITPYLATILPSVQQAFAQYGLKNQLVLCDVVGTLADAVGSALANPQFTGHYLPDLMRKFAATEDFSDHIFPVMECVSSVVMAIGLEFQSYAFPVTKRTLFLLAETIKSNVGDTAEGDPIHKDFAVCSLDLLSALVEGLGHNFSVLLNALGQDSGGNPFSAVFIGMLSLCLEDSDADVRQSAFALAGECFKSGGDVLSGCVDEVLRLTVKNFRLEELMVCNNAVWCVGEIAGRAGAAGLGPLLSPALLEGLVQLLLCDEIELSLSLRQNVAITLGRIGTACPEALAPLLPDILVRWCNCLRLVQSPVEQVQGYSGLLSVLPLNPQAVLAPGGAEAFVVSCCSLGGEAEVDSPQSVAVIAGLRDVLRAIHDHDVNLWNQIFSSLEEDARTAFSDTFQLR